MKQTLETAGLARLQQIENTDVPYFTKFKRSLQLYDIGRREEVDELTFQAKVAALDYAQQAIASTPQNKGRYVVALTQHAFDHDDEGLADVIFDVITKLPNEDVYALVDEYRVKRDAYRQKKKTEQALDDVNAAFADMYNPADEIGSQVATAVV